MKRIEHLGIAVQSIEQSLPLFEALLNTVCYKQEAVASEGVKTAFFQVGESKIELLDKASLQLETFSPDIMKKTVSYTHLTLPTIYSV